MLEAGDCIGSFEIVAPLQDGGMATLFLARRRGAAGFSRHVAIKVVHRHLARDASFVRMFVEEALLSARIQHPNVVHVEELGEADDTYFLVMEYVHGCALNELLVRLRKLGARMTPDVATAVALQVLAGLHAAHDTRGEDGKLLGVVHRDVSPQNVLLSSAGHVKLIDFGIAKAAGRAQRTATGTLKGKLAYMAPEQAYGRDVDRRTDVYAAGVVLWEMLTSRRLFRADNDFALLDVVREPVVEPPSKYAEGLPPALDAAVLSALAREPDGRPPTAEALRERLIEAVPSATRVAPSALADLLHAAAGELLYERRLLLPKSVVDQVPQRPPRPSAIQELTVSSPMIAAERDDAQVSDERRVAVARARSAGRRGASPARARWAVVVAAIAAAIAVGAVVALTTELDPPPPSAAAAPTPPIPPVAREPERAERPPTTAIVVDDAPDDGEESRAEEDRLEVERDRRTKRRLRRRAQAERERETSQQAESGSGGPILLGEDAF